MRVCRFLCVSALLASATSAYAQNDYLQQIEAEAQNLSQPAAPAAVPPANTAIAPQDASPPVSGGAVSSRSDPRARSFERHLSSVSQGAYSLYSQLNDFRKLEVINLYVASPRSGDDKLDPAIEKILAYF